MTWRWSLSVEKLVTVCLVGVFVCVNLLKSIWPILLENETQIEFLDKGLLALMGWFGFLWVLEPSFVVGLEFSLLIVSFGWFINYAPFFYVFFKQKPVRALLWRS